MAIAIKNNKEEPEKRLFNLIKKIGEGVFDKIHIIDNSDLTDESSYRIYHADGYCWDISIEPEYEWDDENDEDRLVGYYYSFDEEWEGFKQSGINLAITEIEKIKKLQYNTWKKL